MPRSAGSEGSDPGRSVFFGTPEFAVPSLDALCDAGADPALVVSQPARPVGRHRTPRQPPVARRALERGLALEQPESVRSESFLGRLSEIDPDVCVVVAFGQIFPDELLALPRLGCVNLHASLLPRHRGAAPVQAAIAAGDRSTGVTTMLMESGLDSGPILLTREVPIEPRETAGELSVRLAEAGASLLVETLAALRRGELTPREQDHAAATYARRLRREDGRLDWTAPAPQLARRIRAYDPWPGTFTEVRGETIKVLEADWEAADPGTADPAAAEVGRIAAVEDGALVVGCGDGGRLALRRVQRAGKRAISGRELANGMRLEIGQRLGGEPVD